MINIMGKANQSRIVLFAVTIAVLSLAFGMGTLAFDSSPEPAARQLANNISDAELPPLDPAAASGEYYTVREDMRRCASPRCGGYFVSRVNQSRTRCADRRWLRECYVAEIDWNGQAEVEARKALLRGDIVSRRFERFGNLGAFRVTESWQSPSDRRPATGTFYRARDRGVRCITHPCLTHAAAKLNANFTTNVAGVDLAAAGANGETISAAAAAMTQPDGVLVAGYFATVTGPGGRAQTLKATAFYFKGYLLDGTDSGAKRCFKTGCSSQVCADHDVVTTCEYRPEYACYQKAMCERQRTGECGFTMTPELRACLARAKR